MTHHELLLSVFPLFIRVLKKNQSFRPTFITAMSYWLAPVDSKLTYRPGRQSLYPKLLQAALAAATKEEKANLKVIIRLGSTFLPLESNHPPHE